MGRSVLLISVQEDLDVLGLKSLHGHLLRNEYDSHLLFCPRMSDRPLSSKDTRSLCALVDRLSPFFIGVSMMSVEFERAVRMTNALKEHDPSVPIVWGGVHPTLVPEECLEHADFVCRGEGESFILDFASALSEGESPDGIPSLCFRREGRTIQNPVHPLITDLAVLPPGEHVQKNSYVLQNGAVTPLNIRVFRKHARYSGTTYSIMSSRGCPYSCTYCCNNALAGIYGRKKTRFRAIPDVIDELKEAVTRYPFIEYVNFQDDCFLSRTEEDIERFCRSYQKEIERPFIARSIPTFISERKIELLRSAGLAWISLGLQSGSDHVCREIYKRRSSKEDFLKAATAVKNQGLAAFYDVILDNPFETDEDRIQTVLTLMETPKPFYTQFFSLSFYPGTELRRRALEEGLTGEHEYRSKDYQLYSGARINHLVRLATFIPVRWMEFLLELYRRKPTSRWFRMNLSVARIYSAAFAEPLTYLRVIRLSQRKRLGATIRVLPYFMKEGLSRFRKQFG